MSSAKGATHAILDAARRAAPPATSLAGRLSAWFLATSLLLVLLTSAILYWGAVQTLHSADEQVLEKRAEALSLLIADGTIDNAVIAHEVNEELTGPRQVFVRLIAPSGETIDETQLMSKAVPRSLFQEAGTRDRFVDLEAPDGRRYRAFVRRVKMGTGHTEKYAVIQAAADTTYDEEALSWFRRLLAAVTSSAAILSVMTGWWIVRSQLAPLGEVTRAASLINTKNLRYRLKTERLPDELEDLARQFNGMLQRLETAYEGLQHYADNVAHELRTPVNRMLVGTEVVLAKSRTGQEYREALEANMDECQRLKLIVEKLLFLARAENSGIVLDLQSVDVGQEIALMRDYYEASAAEAGVRLEVETPPRLEANLDRLLIQRAMSNLISNALSHTPPGGSVRIAARLDGSSIAIEVSDTGEGIDQESQRHVFDRFYRADDVRSPTEHSIGLGLPITKTIVELHGGTIAIDSKLGFGTSVMMRIPALSARLIEFAEPRQSAAAASAAATSPNGLGPLSPKP